MRVLCVAEKPSIAKSVSQILSGGQFATRNTSSRFIKNYDFDYPQTKAHFTMTSVIGHLTTQEFDEAHSKWHSCDPFTLFDAPVKFTIASNSEDIEKNLISEARRSDMLMVWTDCDREGEHIGWEIARVCRGAKRNIEVKRARFSAIIAQQVHHAAQHPTQLDQAQADAVEARIILDLRLGAAFTRMQTLALQGRITQLKESSAISYGPCQFPTLGFVVSRYKLVKEFVPEPFWKIDLSLSRANASTGNTETHFTWKRGHIFDFEVAVALYQHVLSNPLARVAKVVNKSVKKWKPLPLTTVELQKAGSRLLHLTPKKILDVAEKLYQEGFLSYPRTETDQFDPQFDLMALVGKQTVDPAWGEFATSLQNGGFSAPRKGSHNDKAHPPIHPTAHAGNLTGDGKRVYEYITRRFLACCSKHAEGWETVVHVVCGGEFFETAGLVILERNYLLVYPYDKWNGKEVPEFEEGEEFQPTVCELTEGQTTSPAYLTEADLVTLMDKNGIGTDATIAQHIQTIIDRDYVLESMEGNTKYLVPTKLGIGLIEGYSQIGLEKSLSKPFLRRETEKCMVQVCEGTKSKSDMIDHSIVQYKEMFITARREFDKVISSVRRFIQGNEQQDHDDDGGGGHNGDDGRRMGGGGGAPPSRRRSGPRPPPPPASGFNNDDSNDPPPPSFPPPSRGRQTNRSSTLGSMNQINCRCGVPAAERTVTKDSVSKGRKFLTCNERVCNFFEWTDGISPNSASEQCPPETKTIPTKRPYSDRSVRNAESEPSRQCHCKLTAVQRTASKEGPNQGRQFWTCPNGPRAKCAYFEWDDELIEKEINGSSVPTQGGGQPCFKCGQQGHWANACNGNGNAGINSKPSKSIGSKATTSDSCFACGEQGHYSTSCPNKGFTSKPQSGAELGSCFKCGETGHWSSSCPNGDGISRSSSRGSRKTPTASNSSKTRGKAKTRGGRKKSTFGPPED